MTQHWWKQTRYKWSFIGACLSFLGPLGEWIFFRLVTDQEPLDLWWAFLYTELWTLVLFSSFGYLLGNYAEKLEHIAFHDTLTGIFSRRVLMEQFKELLALHHRYQNELTLIMFDLDFFKKVNDQHGHLVGDKTLISVANTVKMICRSSDVFGRFGGEEFLVLCPNTSQEEGLHLAERIRQEVSNIAEEQLGFPGPQTVSIGIITVPHTHRLPTNSILKSLDDALYHAKAEGRNRVQVSHSNYYKK